MGFLAMAVSGSGNTVAAPDELLPDGLRLQQVTVMARWTPPLAVCSVLSAGVVVLTFWHSAPHAGLLALLASLSLMHGLAVVRSLAWLRRPAAGASRRALHLRVGVSAAVALIWATALALLLPRATLEQRQLLIYVGSGLMSASILLAPVRTAALAFLGITTAGLLLPMPFIAQSISPAHTLLILLYAATTCGLVHSQSRDFTRRVRDELTLKEQSDIIGLLLHDFEESASDFLWEVDAGCRLRRVSERFARLTGHDAPALQGASLLEWIEGGAAGTAGGDGAGGGNAAILAALAARQPFRDVAVELSHGGRTVWLSLTGKPLLDAAGRFLGYRGVGSDLTALRRSDERIAHLARHDSLTDLPNRVQFRDALEQARARGEPVALHCLDLDGFKSVNDTLGHAMGDALLVAVAGRLRGCLREGDVVARLGGDEFAVLQATNDANAAAALAQRLVARVAEPCQLGQTSTSVGLSVGVMLSTDAASTEELLQGADLALYHSKSEGRGTWSFFEPGMATLARERHALHADLQRAIASDELFVEYQPITDFETGTITAAEALVRWEHPLRGRVSPASFIPAAEESGLIVALGAWVLRAACAQASTWAGQARVAVNLSPLQFRDPGLLELVDRVLAQTGLPAHRLELEITESVFLEDVAYTLSCLNALRERGVHIALDDFGTGYSSLSYLRSFPFDKVKIDQSFIRDLSVNGDAITIVQAIIGMASGLGMRTTGEGVETLAQAELLRRSGCTQVQGYLYGRPCSPERIAAMMTGSSRGANLALAGD